MAAVPELLDLAGAALCQVRWLVGAWARCLPLVRQRGSRGAGGRGAPARGSTEAGAEGAEATRPPRAPGGDDEGFAPATASSRRAGRAPVPGTCGIGVSSR